MNNIFIAKLVHNWGYKDWVLIIQGGVLFIELVQEHYTTIHLMQILFKMWMRHNLFYVDNTSQVREGLRGTLSEELKKGLVGVPVLNSSRSGGL